MKSKKYYNRLFKLSLLLIIATLCVNCSSPSNRFIKDVFKNKDKEFKGYIGTPGETLEVVNMKFHCDENLNISGYYTNRKGVKYGLKGKIEKKRREYIMYLDEYNNSFEKTGAQFVISDFDYNGIEGTHYSKYFTTQPRYLQEYVWQVTKYDPQGKEKVAYQIVREVCLEAVYNF